MGKAGVKWKITQREHDIVYECACQGASDSLIRKELKIDWRTWNKYLPEFANDLQRGKEFYLQYMDRFVGEVVNSLRRRCIGYDAVETTVTVEEGVRKTTTKSVHVPASVTAIIFYLSNRANDHFKNNAQINHLNNGKSFDPSAPLIVVEDEETRQIVESLVRDGRKAIDTKKSATEKEDAE